MYSFDISKNVYFPATVSATTFVENGTSLSNKYQTKNGDLTAIAALTGTGYAKRTADNT